MKELEEKLGKRFEIIRPFAKPLDACFVAIASMRSVTTFFP
jgi:hypothetical protein